MNPHPTDMSSRHLRLYCKILLLYHFNLINYKLKLILYGFILNIGHNMTDSL